jgi:hypothetical protein
MLHAADWYVSPTGSASGNGSVNSPWDLHTGMQASSIVKPGDTIWVRGGTYSYSSPSMFQVNLTGTAAAPIIIRHYPSEWAIIDLRNNGDEFVMDHRGRVLGTDSSGNPVTAWNNSDYVWLWGLEITATGIPRSTSNSGSFGIGSIVDVAIYGVGVKIINCYIHDMHGVGFWSTSTGAEINGTLIGNMGWNAPDRGHGHNLYVQNDGSGSTKQIKDVFLYNSFDIGMQWYGTGAALIQNITADGVTIVNSGAPIGQGTGQLVIAGGGASKRNLTYNNGWSFVSPVFSNAFSEIGWVFDGINQNVDIEGNFWGNTLLLEHWNQLTFRNNTVKGGITLENYDGTSPAQSTAGWALDSNTYGAGTTFTLGSSHLDANGSPVTSDNRPSFSQWAASLPGQELHSAANAVLPQKVVIRPNTYEPGRANVIIYNPQSSPTVAVDLSQIGGLKTGDAWELRDALNFRGNPVLSGIYSSSNPIIQVPMTGLTAAQVAGWGGSVPHTAPLFGEFVVLASVMPDSTAPAVSLTAPAAGSVSGTVTVSATATDNVGVAGVQFQLDGVTLGAEDTVTPYSISWDTTTATTGNHSLTAVARDAAGNKTVSAPVAVTVTNPIPAASAAFVKTDTTTKGSWKGNYGPDGYAIANVVTSYPTYAQVTAQGATPWTWSSASTDPRVLVSQSSSTRLASTWYSSTTLKFDVNLTDGNSHVVSMYCLDYDSTSRAESVSVLNASSAAVLDTRTVTNFNGGVWLVWKIAGHVTLQVTRTAGSNAVVSGLFFGAPTLSTASFVSTDSTTQGTWKGVYGADGAFTAGDANNPASYAQVAFAGQNSWTWATNSTDLRALQQANGSSRTAATWYATNAFTIDVNLTDGQTHKVSLYCVDFDSSVRTDQITVIETASGVTLDTRSLSSFHSGDYLSWNVSGHVTFQITRTAGANAVVSGLFFR